MFYTNHKGIDVVMERFVVSAINRLQVRGTNSSFCYRKKSYSPIVEVLKVSTAYQEIINQTYLSGILIKKNYYYQILKYSELQKIYIFLMKIH